MNRKKEEKENFGRLVATDRPMLTVTNVLTLTGGILICHAQQIFTTFVLFEARTCQDQNFHHC